MARLTPDELRDMIGKGLGRAHVALEQGRNDALADALVAGCLENLTYDSQIEGSRASYLLELVRLLGAEERLAKVLENPLVGSPDDRDLDQRFELMGLLARDGVDQMRISMYRGFEQLIDRWVGEPSPALRTSDPARELIALDGMAGAAFVFAQLGRVAAVDTEYWDDGDLVGFARADIEDVDAAIAAARAADPRVDAYLTAVERQRSIDRAHPTEARRPDWRGRPWSEIHSAIERDVRGTGGLGLYATQWGVQAPDDQLALAAQALVDLPKTDLELLRPYLRVFGRRRYPLDPSTLIELLDDERDKVAWFAANALELIGDPAVRAAALRMAAFGPLRERTLDLLTANWQPGDEVIAEGLLRVEADIEATHTLVSGLCDLVESHPSADLVPALLLGYERTPCSQCRSRLVGALLYLDALPASLRAECRWDSSQETRELVA